MSLTRVINVYATCMLFTPINGNVVGKSGRCEFYYFCAVILCANSLIFWKSAVKTLIYMKVWKTKFPIFISIRHKMSEPVTYCVGILGVVLVTLVTPWRSMAPVSYASVAGTLMSVTPRPVTS